jgi:hypothetical protein
MGRAHSMKGRDYKFLLCPSGVAVTLHTTLMLACCLSLRDVQVYAGLFDMFVTLH